MSGAELYAKLLVSNQKANLANLANEREIFESLNKGDYLRVTLRVAHAHMYNGETYEALAIMEEYFKWRLNQSK